ncbi:S-adenosylmethionine:tRNA ribosyltransferase-isomerase [Haliangium ochraceum]|uniref:Queuosine biosynthesis protein n=1 Tax=Haliangium ochraceum (strain DSM 14365 / JCM 11303 / SMP-2) TaxID=502025 RepID=D0LSN9_HALO1|nr:S-adenosylmethionine:tRNA ribosyltransferase-isomerase [Haliangium ochraceum]ACY17261.1 Queuosine biosynthesis protein [Haliangium ochraceum DSM 14365]
MLAQGQGTRALADERARPPGSAPRPSLRPGRDPGRPLEATRLLSLRGADIAHHRVGALVELLAPGDLLVLNDAATLPASLRGHVAGAEVELRLAGALGDRDFPAMFRAVLFGAGDWRQDTERRPPPPLLGPGARIELDGFSATVRARAALSPRLLTLEFDRADDQLAEAVYRAGRPVQYRHLDAPLPLSAVQTPYAWRPWAVEMPSTGRPLSWALLDRLAAAGIEHAFLTHAAGLSATGDPALDAALPLPERYAIPAQTARACRVARARGGRIVAVGTTVVRALESARGVAGAGVATERISRRHRLRAVDGILTGIHAPGESHFELLEAFAAPAALRRVHAEAVAGDYLAHELGDLMMIMPAR